MTGLEFEEYCADVLRKNGYKGVKVTKASGDQGIDVLAKKGGLKYAIQCKYYSSPVGNSAVQEAYAGKEYYGCDIAAVMTNTTFTKGARDLADSTGVELWENVGGSYSINRRSRLGRFGTILLIISIFGMIGVFTEISDHGLQQDDKEVLILTSAIIIVVGGIKMFKFVKKRKGSSYESEFDDADGTFDRDIEGGSSFSEAAQEPFDDDGTTDEVVATHDKYLYESNEEMMKDAIDLVVELGQASVSALQRRFRIGYSRATRMIDAMESMGIIGPPDGAEPRKVICTDPSQIEKALKTYDPKIDYGAENRVRLEQTVDEKEVLEVLKITRLEETLPLTDIIPVKATIITGSTHEDRLGIVDRVIASTSFVDNKIILIDSQGFYSIYNGLTNLLIPVVTDPEKCRACARWVNADYSDRIKHFAEKRVRSKEQYNDISDVDTKISNVLTIIYDAELDSAYIEELAAGVLLHGDVAGIYTLVFSNNSNASIVKKAVQKGFEVKDVAEI